MQAPTEQHGMSPGDEKVKFIKQRSLSVRKAVPTVVAGQSWLMAWLAVHLPSLTRKLEKAHHRLLKAQDRLLPFCQQFEKYRRHCVEVSEPYFVPVVCLLQAACAVAVFCICMFKVDKFFRPSEAGFEHPPGWSDLAPGLLNGSPEAHGRAAWQPAAMIPPPHASCLLGLTDNGVCLCSLGIWTCIASLAVTGALYFSLDECCACDVYYLNKAVQAGVAATGALLWAAVGGVLVSYHRRAGMAAVALPHWRMAVGAIALGACGMFLLVGVGVAVSVWSSGWEAPENSLYDPARQGKMPLDWDPFDPERGREGNLQWRHEFTQFTERQDIDDEEERGGGGGRDQSYGSW